MTTKAARPGQLKALRLDPEQRADAGLARVYLTLLDAMEANRNGCLQVGDHEAVHDLRVATRRTRAGLSEIRKVLPTPVVEARKADFRRVGDATGPARDLDVFLLKLGGLIALVEPADREALEPVADLIRGRRLRAQAPMAGLLTSDWYLELLTDWRSYLEGLPDDAGPKHASRPLVDVARRRIRKRYRKVVRRGLAIDDATPPGELHRLRLDCKKLRYLLEFFRSLFEPEQMARFIATLKQLQNNLGDFNDCTVQLELLSTLTGDDVSATTAAALRRLSAAIDRVRGQERAAFQGAFAPFAAEPTRQLFEHLFG